MCNIISRKSKFCQALVAFFFMIFFSKCVSENAFWLAIFQHSVYDSRSDELNQFHQNQNHDY